MDALCAVIPGVEAQMFQLHAPLPTLHERVRKREIGSGLDWHLNRAGELLAILTRPEAPCAARIDTDGPTVREIALELADRVHWR